MDSDDLRDYIQNFSFDSCRLGNQGYSRVLIQLFGYTGHGKSSFINSCKYVVDDGPYKIHAEVARAEEGPQTMSRSSYALSGAVTLVDNRGCVRMNEDETGEIYLQLGNFLPVDSRVSWQTGYDETIRKLLDSDRQDNSTDFIVPVFVYSAQTMISHSEFKNMNNVLLKARNITGLMPTVVITHELSPNLSQVVEKFRQMGVKNLFPLENYTEDDYLKTRGKHEALLKCLYEIVRDVQFRMKERRDPIEEKCQRKEILLKFVHEREKERAVEEALDRERKRNAYVPYVPPVAKDDSCVIL